LAVERRARRRRRRRRRRKRPGERDGMARHLLLGMYCACGWGVRE